MKRAELWDAINDYCVACGGTPSSDVYGNTRRQQAVVDIERVVTQLENAKCEQLKDVLRRILPMAEAWFRREFDGLCDHEPGECHCDREAHARTDINIAISMLK